MPKVTDEQRRLAQEIHNLRMKVEGEGYWKPEYGDWFVSGEGIPLIVSFVRKNRRGVIIYTDNSGNYFKENCFPIPSWADCRALLRKMGWILDTHEDAIGHYRGDKWIYLIFYHRGRDRLIEVKAPTDLEAIMLVVLEVLERRRRREG